MAWEFRSLATEFPQEFGDLVDGAESLSTSLETVNSLLTEALNVAKTFVATNRDPYAAFVEALLEEAENVVGDFFGTGLFQLSVLPTNVENPRYDLFGFPLLTPAEAIQHATRSFDDAGDTARPQFSDSAEVAGFGIMVTAATLDDFVEKLEGLLTIFDLADFRKAWEKAQRSIQTRDGTVPSRTQQPDWQSVRLEQIPGFSEVRDALDEYLNQLQGYAQVGDNFIDDILRAIENKVRNVTRALDALSQSIDTLVDAIGATGVYWLDIEQATGGNTYLKSSLADPNLSALTQNRYTAMLLIVGGSASLTGLNNIKSLIE